MSEKDIDEIQEFNSIRLKVLYNEPLFSYVLYNLNVRAIDNPYVLAFTDGKTITIGTELWNKLSQQEKIFVILHELMHVVLEHPFIHASVSVDEMCLLNAVEDVIINKVLTERYQPPKGVLLKFADISPTCKDLDNIEVTEHTTLWFFEEVKKRIPKVKIKCGCLSSHKQNNQSSQEGQSQTGGQNKDNKTDKGNQGQAGGQDGNQGNEQGQCPVCGGCVGPNSSQELKDMIRGYIKAGLGLGIGSLAGDLSLMLEKLHKTTTDWRSLVRKWFRVQLEDEYTFAKPKQYGYVILPRLIPFDESKLDMILMIDSSGSISDELLYRFAFELYTIMVTVGRKVYLIVNDADIQLTKMIENVEDIPKKFPGRGGTMFKKAFEHLVNAINMLEEPLVVVLTDGLIGDLKELKKLLGKYAT